MRITVPKRVRRTYTQRLEAEPARVFPLLCPVRETEWIAGWEPLQVLSDSGVAESDCVFLTQAFPCDAIWYVTRHEPEEGFLEMIKITPEVTACRLTIRLAAADVGTEATITYLHTSLGPEGDAYIDSFSEEFYRNFMQEWEARMNHFLATGEPLLTDET